MMEAERRTERAQLRVTPTERRRLEWVATREGMSLSAWVRTAALRAELEAVKAMEVRRGGRS